MEQLSINSHQQLRRFPIIGLCSVNISVVYFVPLSVGMPGHTVSETTSAAHFHHIFFPHCGDWLFQCQPVKDGAHIKPLFNVNESNLTMKLFPAKYYEQAILLKQ